jgi:sugar/nucleoside kinase (ribokinase family)
MEDRRPSGERRVLVLGDLCLDSVVSSRLPLTWASAAAAGEPVLRVHIADQVGGTAYQFTHWAARFGLCPVIIGCVGRDAAGDLIMSRLAATNLAHAVQRSASAPTARSLAVFDALGTRFMFTSQVNANDELSADFMRSHGSVRSDLVWLSGLCLRSRNAPRFHAVAEAVAIAREQGSLIVLDVVPHDFHLLFGSLEEVRDTLGHLDGLVSDVTTARRLLGMDLPEGPQAELLPVTAAALLDLFPLAVTQCHDGTTFHQLAVSRSGFNVSYVRPVPAGSALVGYGDALASEVLRDYLRHRAGSLKGSGSWPVAPPVIAPTRPVAQGDGRRAGRTGELR